MAKSDMKKQSKAAIKIKKKQWFNLFAPKSMGEKPLGESYLEDPETAVGRTVQVNLMQLTGDMKSQSSDLKFEITGYKEGKLETKPIGYTFSGATLKRYMRRHMTRIDDSLVIKTSDGVKIRIKPFILTRSKVSRAVEYVVRQTAKQELITSVSKISYDDLYNLVVRYTLQKELKDKLSKVYPIKNLEIKALELEKEDAVETPLPAKKIERKVKDKKPLEAEDEKQKTEETSEESAEEPAVEETEETQ